MLTKVVPERARYASSMKTDFRFMFMIARAIRLVAIFVLATVAALGIDVSSCADFIDLIGDCVTRAELLYVAVRAAITRRGLVRGMRRPGRSAGPRGGGPAVVLLGARAVAPRVRAASG